MDRTPHQELDRLAFQHVAKSSRSVREYGDSDRRRKRLGDLEVENPLRRRDHEVPRSLFVFGCGCAVSLDELHPQLFEQVANVLEFAVVNQESDGVREVHGRSIRPAPGRSHG